jgi:hypothetical protein
MTPAPTRPRSTVSTVLAKFAQMIKGTDQAALDDITDVIDHATTPGDQWQTNYRQPNQTEVPTSAAERMSGDGVSPMIGRHSEPTAANEADATAQLGDRLESMEKCLRAIMGHIFKADTDENDDRFPNSETTKDKTGDEEDETAKAGDISKMSVADVFSYFSGKLTKAAKLAAEKAERGVATPPNMNAAGRAVMKSQHETLTDRLDSDEGMTMGERITLRVKANSALMRAQGAPISEVDRRTSLPGSYAHF